MNKKYENIKRLIRHDWPMHIILLATGWLPDNVIFMKIRGYLAKPFFKSCGKNLRLGRGLVFYNCSNIIIRDNVYIAYGNWFSASTEIKIESDVLIGPKCVFSSSNHLMHEGSFSNELSKREPISIGRGSWVAANCTITAGTKIGKSSSVGAGSVTFNHFLDKVFIAGNPAKVIKNI